jgi:hypothetical protein
MKAGNAIEDRQDVWPAELGGLDVLSPVDPEVQLTAHGPEGDGAISAVGAEAQGLSFVEEPEVVAPVAEAAEDEPG